MLEKWKSQTTIVLKYRPNSGYCSDQLAFCVRYVFEESVKIRLLRMINVKKSTGEALYELFKSKLNALEDKDLTLRRSRSICDEFGRVASSWRHGVMSRISVLFSHIFLELLNYFTAIIVRDSIQLLFWLNCSDNDETFSYGIFNGLLNSPNIQTRILIWRHVD